MLRVLTLAAAAILFAQAGLAQTVGISMSGSDPFLNVLANAIKASGEKSGTKLDLQIADYKADVQYDQLTGFIEKGYDAIIINAVADEKSEVIQQMAAEKGIPLVYVNRVPPQTRFPGPVSVVSCNEIVAGRLQMRYLASQKDGKGNVVILRGEDSHPAAGARTQGMKEVLANYPEMTLVHEQSGNWSRDEAEKIITGLLDKGMKIDVIAANNDEMAIGAIRALEKANASFDDVFVGGVDGTDAALAEMAAGKLKASVLQNAVALGERSIGNAVEMAKGQYAQEFDWVPYELIIPANREKYAMK